MRMKYAWKIFIIFFFIFAGCSNGGFFIKKFEQADIIHNDVRIIESSLSSNATISCSTYYLLFLVKNPQKDIAELYESLDSHAKNYLKLNKQDLINAIKQRYPETNKARIQFLYYRTSKMLPWNWKADQTYSPPIEGYPVDLIGDFIFDVNSGKFKCVFVVKRSKNFFHYGKVTEEIVNKEK